MKNILSALVFCPIFFAMGGCASISADDGPNRLTDGEIKIQAAHAIGSSPSGMTIFSRTKIGGNVYIDVMDYTGQRYACTINTDNSTFMGIPVATYCNKK